ncbi:hypothetical protein Tcan_17458, partial [Toxocara canis]
SKLNSRNQYIARSFYEEYIGDDKTRIAVYLHRERLKKPAEQPLAKHHLHIGFDKSKQCTSRTRKSFVIGKRAWQIESNRIDHRFADLILRQLDLWTAQHPYLHASSHITFRSGVWSVITRTNT